MDLDKSEQIARQLAYERDPTSRAALSMDLIRLTSIVEDTMERAVHDLLEQRAPALAARARAASMRLREAMLPLDHRMRHVEPADVRRSDPEGFEQDLIALVETLHEVRAWESAELFPFLASLPHDERASVRDRVASAHHHASEHPAPAGPFGRLLHKVGAKMDHHPDTADHEL